MGVRGCTCPTERLSEWEGELVRVRSLCEGNVIGNLTEIEESYLVLSDPETTRETLILCCHICSVEQIAPA